MKSHRFKKLIAAIVAAAHVSTSFAGSFYLVVPVPSYTAAKVGSITVDPTSLTFAGTELGASVKQLVTIRNSGQIAQSSPSITIVDNGAEYAVSDDCPGTLDVGQSCAAEVTYTPVQQTLSGTLRVAFEPAGEQLVSLSGAALFDDLEGGKALGFGLVQPGETAVVSATLYNQGTQDAALSYGSLPSTVTWAGTCADTLAAKASCDLTFSFKAAGDSDRTPLDHLFKIQAKNSAAEFRLTAQPLAAGKLNGAGAIDYGTLVLGSAVSKTFTLTNTGDVAAELTPGALPADVTRAGTCATSLGAGQSCDVIFTWTPAAAGPLNASTALGNALFTLTGTAITEAMLTSSGTTAFGTVLVGETSAQTVTITNSGQQASSVAFGVLPAGVTKTGTCSTSLAGGASCTVTLTWAPAASGSLAENYLITGTNNSLTLALSGSSITPASLSGGSSQSYGTVNVGSSAAKTWTITNSGGATASLTYGSLPTGVTKSGTCATTLAGGASCTVTLTWTPTAAGTLNASYTVGTQTLGMTGTAAQGGYQGSGTVKYRYECVICFGDDLEVEEDTYFVTIPAGTTVPGVGVLAEVNWSYAYGPSVSATNNSGINAVFSSLTATPASVTVTVNGTSIVLNKRVGNEYYVGIPYSVFQGLPKSGTATISVK